MPCTLILLTIELQGLITFYTGGFFLPLLGALICGGVKSKVALLSLIFFFNYIFYPL